MVKNEKRIQEVLPEYIDFISADLIVGHNVNFDINFLYDNLSQHFNSHFKNDFMDTLRLSRKIIGWLRFAVCCNFGQSSPPLAKNASFWRNFGRTPKPSTKIKRCQASQQTKFKQVLVLHSNII